MSFSEAGDPDPLPQQTTRTGCGCCRSSTTSPMTSAPSSRRDWAIRATAQCPTRRSATPSRRPGLRGSGRDVRAGDVGVAEGGGALVDGTGTGDHVLTENAKSFETTRDELKANVEDVMGPRWSSSSVAPEHANGFRSETAGSSAGACIGARSCCIEKPACASPAEPTRLETPGRAAEGEADQV
jgi:hypothetical protein